MRYRDIPKVVQYEPNLAKTFEVGDEIEIRGITFVINEDVQADGFFLTLKEPVLYVLENGMKMTQDEWFERYIHNIDLDLEDGHEDSRKNTIDSVSFDEGGEGEAKLLSDGDAGEREDDARSVLTKTFDFDAE
jgi:hypothetical protein